MVLSLLPGHVCKYAMDIFALLVETRKLGAPMPMPTVVLLTLLTPG
jgi:hypothetical protein